MKTLNANGSRLKSNAGRTKKWNPADEAVIYSYERFHVGTKSNYEAAKKRVAEKRATANKN